MKPAFALYQLFTGNFLACDVNGYADKADDIAVAVKFGRGNNFHP